MMGSYDRILPEVFPYCIAVKDDQAESWSIYLIESEGPATNGSSFAITTDAITGVKKMWLSEVSYNRLKESERVT